MYNWGIENNGGMVHIIQGADNYISLPQEIVLTIDCETDEKDNIVCVGVTGNGIDVYVYFYPTNEFFERLKTKQLVGHDLKSAEIPWIKKYGFSMQNVYMDTKMQAYVQDSARKDWSLKKLVKDIFNVSYPTYKEIVGSGKKKLTLDKQPQEIVAQYNACDVFWTHRLFQYYQKVMTAQQKQFLTQIEMPCNKLLFEVETKGIKIDTKEVRRIHNENSKKRRQFKKTLFRENKGMSFNPNSPKQLLPILQGYNSRIKNTSEDEIKRYSDIPFVKALLDYRGCQKLCSTYTIPLYMEAIKTVDNRIHARFVQNTITGRLSSSDPINLQNQPPSVRSAFIAEDGYQLVDADWTNIELYLPAHFSNERKFIEVLEQPEGDLHRQTAITIFGKSIESLQEEEYKNKRQIAKTCNFLLTNSGSAKRLSVELNCSQKEAEEIYKKFWEGYPVLAQWLKETKRKARAESGVSSMFGRWVQLQGLNAWCGVQNCPIYDPKRGFYCRDCARREAVEREAISIKVQGSAADLMKLAAFRLKREHNLVPIALVHDELMYEEPIKAVEQVAQNVKQVMESLVELKVPLKAKVNIGKRWSDVH